MISGSTHRVVTSKPIPSPRTKLAADGEPCVAIATLTERQGPDMSGWASIIPSGDAPSSNQRGAQRAAESEVEKSAHGRAAAMATRWGPLGGGEYGRAARLTSASSSSQTTGTTRSAQISLASRAT